jgi:hypothetical protein
MEEINKKTNSVAYRIGFKLHPKHFGGLCQREKKLDRIFVQEISLMKTNTL